MMERVTVFMIVRLVGKESRKMGVHKKCGMTWIDSAAKRGDHDRGDRGRRSKADV